MKVGVLGLGAIGANVARVLAGAGFDVVGYDVDETALERTAAFVTPCASPAEVSQASGLVLISVFDEVQVRDVLSGEDSVLAAAAPAPVVAIMSTVSIDAVRWAYDLAAAHGVAILDCPVTGGKQLAEHDTIVVFVGGDERVLESVRPVFEALAEPLLYMGPSGSGIMSKLARNVIHYGTWFAAWEGARLAEGCGLDVAKIVEAVRVSDRWTGATMGLIADYGIGPQPVAADDDERLRMARYLASVSHKDLQAALELGAEQGIDLPGARLNAELYDGVVGLSTVARSAA